MAKRKKDGPPGPCTPGDPCTEDTWCPAHQRFSPLYQPAQEQLAAALGSPPARRMSPEDLAAAEERARRDLAGRKGRGRKAAEPGPVDPLSNPEALCSLLPGKVVARFELRPFDDGRGGTAYDPLLVFMDGSSLAFTTSETDVGEYGSDPCYSGPPAGESTWLSPPPRRKKGGAR